MQKLIKMSNNDFYNDKYVQQEIKKYFNGIKEDCRQILYDTLMETVFSRIPREYKRTGQLENINNIDFKIENDTLYIYFDTSNMEYYSFGRGLGTDTSKLKPMPGDAIIHFLNSGHDISGDYSRNVGDNTGYDYFNNYPSQKFLQLAKERIESKYPNIKVEIFEDQSKIY